MAGPVSPAVHPPANSPASMYLAAFSPRPGSPGGFLGSFKAAGDPIERLRAEETGTPGRDQADVSPGMGMGMRRDWSEGGRSVDGEEHHQPSVSSEALSYLPPRRRAQILLQEMAGLSRRMLELARSGAPPEGAFVPGLIPKQVAIPQLLPSAVLPPEASNAQSTRDIMQMLQVQQYLLTTAVRELQEIEMLGTQIQDVKTNVERANTALKTFALSLCDAQGKLTNLTDEYKDYRHLRVKKQEEEQSSKQGPREKKRKKTKKRVHDDMPRPVDVNAIVAYSEHICMTTFAPPEYAQGRSTMPVPPPCPQEFQLKNSQLYLATEASVGITRVVREPTPPPQPPAPVLPEGAANRPAMPLVPPPGWKPGDPIGQFFDKKMSLPPMPAGWKPGDPLGKLALPPMPAGWKPGDPVPIPAGASAQPQGAAAAGGGERAGVPPAHPAVVPQAPLPVHRLRPPAQPVLQVGHVNLEFSDDEDDDDEEDEDESDEDEEEE